MFSCLYVVSCGGGRSILNAGSISSAVTNLPVSLLSAFAFLRVYYGVVRKVLSPIFVRLVLFITDLI
jgi:hypothetical protein